MNQHLELKFRNAKKQAAKCRKIQDAHGANLWATYADAIWRRILASKPSDH